MEFDHNIVKLVVEEDRLSSLPDELIHMILSYFDMKFSVQACLLSSIWKLLLTSMPCLNFSTEQSRLLCTFAKSVTRVLSGRNHQIYVSSIKLNFRGACNQGFVRQIAKYAFSYNVKKLSVMRSIPRHCYSLRREYPRCLFRSQSLKHFTSSYNFMRPCITTETPWDSLGLTTLHLSHITLRYNNIFTNCVNLKNLTLERFRFMGLEEFDIITPQLSNPTLIKFEGHGCKLMNVIAPQLENLTIYNCSFEYLNSPPGISSLCYTCLPPFQWSKDRFHSLNKAYKEEVVCKTINMLQELQSARYLTLDEDIVQCLSLFPDLLSRNPSPFNNLNCSTIDYTNTKRKDALKVTMSGQVKNFLLENSPSATIIMNHPKVPSV